MWTLIIYVFLPLVSSQCYWNNKNPYPYFGSKTPYDAVRGDFRDVADIEVCEPVSVWFMVRHGTRRPSTLDTRSMKDASKLKDDILKNHANGKGELCAQDVADLRNWTWNPKLDYKTSHLTSKGYEDLFRIGQRFGEKFKTFLEGLHESVLRPTSEQRTLKSSVAFVDGLLGVNRTFVIEDSILDDPVARPYRYCAKRGAEIINSTRLTLEVQRFQKTQEFKQVQENIKRRTGLNAELSPATVMGLYDLCRFYRAYTLLKKNAWCSLFTDHDLMILEYVEDVRHYFRNGYGDSTNLLTGAAGLKDLYEKFLNATNSKLKSLTAYFTHDTMMDMIYSAMGLYRDYPDISGYERPRNRKWRTSFMTPFAANFAAVLHRCPKSKNHAHNHTVQFFVNEREMHLCDDRVCSWKEFKNKFEKFTNATLDFCNEFTYAYTV